MSTPTAEADDALAAFVREDTGIPFDPLLRFAEPLFEAYGVDVGRARALRADAGAGDPEPDELLLVLETSRLVWTAFGLDDAHAPQALADVKALIMPGAHDEQDVAMLHLLLARLEERWHELQARRLPAAGAAPLPFEALAERYRALFPPQDDAPAPAASADELALFARPLLEDPAVADDLDLLDRRMELAQLLFELARQHAPFDEQTRAVRERFPDEAAPEALVMDLNLHYTEHFQ